MATILQWIFLESPKTNPPLPYSDHESPLAARHSALAFEFRSLGEEGIRFPLVSPTRSQCFSTADLAWNPVASMENSCYIEESGLELPIEINE